MSVTNSDRADVVIVGGGPTGLFLANLLGKAGVNTILLERRAVQRVPSMAIGVMPPSLRMFEAIDLAAPVVKAGCEVRTAVVHDQRRQLGSLDLTVLPSPYAFVLSIPQGDLMHQLRDRLAQCPSVRVMEGAEAVSVCQTADTVRLQVVRASRLPLEEAGQRPAPQGEEITAQFVVACDGNHSRMRDLLGLARVGRRYGVAFIMGDFPDTTTWSHEAHLFFTPQGSVESFPLPNGRRRWIALANSEKRDTQTLVQRVQEIAAVSLDPAAELWHSSFIPERQLAQHYSSGRVVLCGDAAHVMSPIGGQGMNTGFGDVWQLATLLPQLLQTREPHEPCFARYDAERRHAFTIAADRAERGMWLGTRMGKWSSAIRSFVIGRVLLRPPLVRRLPRYFAMLTIPGNDQLMPAFENSRATGWRSHSNDAHADRRWERHPVARFSLRRERLADPHSKRELNREIFDIAAARYDIITRVLSFGQDAAWKDRLIASLPARTSPVCVDLACGTGDLTRRLAVRFPDADVLGLDLNASMLALAGVRTVGVARIRYLQGDMGATGLDAESVDLVTGGYAIRNAGDLDEALQEIHRILKPGGIAAFLDFSKPAQPVWQQLELALLRFWGGLWGLLFHRSPGVYMYIAESLQRFPDRKQLAEKFRAHGFDVVSSKLHFCGFMQRVVLEKRGAGKERRISARADLIEEMDRPDCPENLLFRTLAQFAKVNRLFSRYRTLLKKHVLADMATDRTRVWRFVDLGAGGCDIDRWLVAQCRRLGVKVSVVAVERDARVRRFAQQANVGYPEIEVVAADVLTGDYLDGADYVFANHLLHHLTDAQCVALLHRIDQARPRVYVLSDILRSRTAYCGYAAIAPLLFRNSFVVADGLASICRSFTVPEAKALLAAAALVHPVVVKQLLPGRLVLVGGRGAAAG